MRTFLAVLLLAVALFSCKTTDPAPDFLPTDTGTLALEFDNVAGSQDLAFGRAYANAAGEGLTFSALKYYISNIELTRADGSTYTVPQDSSYFLIDESVAASHIVRLRQVPAGNYTGVRYLLGVDSLRSTMPLERRRGVLDPVIGEMYWTWNSGYIFFKAEGSSPAIAADKNGNRNFMYHIGLFGGYQSPTLNNLKAVRLTLPEAVQVRKNTRPQVHLLADVLRVFDGPARISVAANPVVMASPFSATVATNLAQVFSVSHVHQHGD